MEAGSGGAPAPGPGVAAGGGVDGSTPESSSSAAAHAMGPPMVESGGRGGGVLDVCGEVFERLVARGHVAAAAPESVTAFRTRLEAHFARLPDRYQLILDIEKPETVLIDMKVLEEAKDNVRLPSFHLHYAKHDGLEGETSGESTSISKRRICEVIFGAIDKPRLLIQLSCLLHDIGLNISDIHVFSTKDGYCLAIFVTDVMPHKDTTCLHEALHASMLRKEDKFHFNGLPMRVQPDAQRRVSVKKKRNIQKLNKNMMAHFHAVLAAEVSILLPMMTAFFAIDSPVINADKGNLILIFIISGSIALFGLVMSRETTDSKWLPAVKLITLHTSISSLALFVYTLAVFLPTEDPHWRLPFCSYFLPDSDTHAGYLDWMLPFCSYFTVYGGLFLIGAAVIVFIWRSMFDLREDER